MTKKAEGEKGEPAPYTMDDIARRFLGTAPTPDRAAPKKKPVKKKSKAKSRSPRGR